MERLTSNVSVLFEETVVGDALMSPVITPYVFSSKSSIQHIIDKNILDFERLEVKRF